MRISTNFPNNLLNFLVILKKLFNFYAEDGGLQGKRVSFRSVCRFFEEFALFSLLKPLNKSQLQLIYSRVLANKRPCFASFLEILYKTHENFAISSKTTQNSFKNFLEKHIFPTFSKRFSRNCEFSFERVQVFYQNSNIYENPAVCLLYESDNLLKHVIFFGTLFEKPRVSHRFSRFTRFST